MSRHGSSCSEHPFDSQISEFLSLPDDALLAVLAYLPLRELFSCRVVCRRLRDLCLHPDLWRNAEVGGRGGLAVACYALAPCLRRLGSYMDPVSEAQTFLDAGGNCVVARLGICVDFPGTEFSASDLIRRLSARGGLRSVTLEPLCGSDEICTPSLLNAVCDIDSLQELHFVNCDDEDESLPDPGGPVKASLTGLAYDSQSADPFLQYLLEAHAATLEEVHLRIENRDVPMTLLAKIPGLRTLSCPAQDDMCELLVLPKLDTVVFPQARVFPAGVLNFLRRARHLRHVTVDSLIPVGPESVSPLFALAESRSARAVESIEFYGGLSGEDTAAVLPRLPSLKELTLEYTGSDDFAHAISPTSAPSLTKVTLAIWNPEPFDLVCWHSWLHGSALPGLLQRNPRLHLQLRWVSRRDADGCCNCPVCLQGCHSQFMLLPKKTFLFSSHGEEARCPLGCVQLAVSTSSPP